MNYSDIKSSLESIINKCPAGGKIPSDRILAETLGVSPRTINRHLIRFVEKGIITRTPGRGTFRTGGVTETPPVHTPLSAPEELADHFRRSIALGEFKSGEALPSIKRVSLQFKVSYRTAIDAYRVLQYENLVFKTGKTFWVGTLKEQIHPPRVRQIFLFRHHNYDFTELYDPDIMGRWYQRMEKELLGAGYLVRYENSDNLEELAAKWQASRTWPNGLVFCNTNDYEFIPLIPVLARVRRKLGHNMPCLLFDWHVGRYDGSQINTKIFARGNILTSASRTLATFLRRKKCGHAAVFINEPGHTWGFSAASLGLLRLYWVIRGYDPDFSLRFAIRPWNMTPKHLHYLHTKRLEQQIRVHSLRTASKPTDKDVKDLHRATPVTADFREVFDTFLENPVWIFDRDIDAAAAIEWAAGKGLHVPDDLEIITLQNDPRYFHLGLTYCGPDWDTIGYQVAHALIGDLPVATTSKGFIRAGAAVIEKLTTK